MKEEKQPYFLVIGLGASGLAMAKFLNTRGKTVIATDIDASKAAVAKELNALGIKTEIGFHDQETFNRAKVMVPSPGIPLTCEFIKTAHHLGVGITGELDIFAQYNNLPVIAITGTNGKTTTTTLIGHMLKACGMKPFVGGNIGTPLVNKLLSDEAVDVIVAEISSFQLDLSNKFKPDTGILLNISEDHLDRYRDYKAYEASKWSLFKNQDASNKAVLNQSIPGVERMSKKLKSTIFTFSSKENIRTKCDANIGSRNIEITLQNFHKSIPADHLKKLCGAHNRENIAAAILACIAFGTDTNMILKGLKTFQNLPHRMEFVQTIDNVSFYNDSKATNTDAVIRAIECFNKNIILILGGREKGTDFSLLVNAVKKSVKMIVALGESRVHVKKTFKNICLVLEVQTMKDAVYKAFDKAKRDDIVLLSPACASFDMYENYIHRGNDFITHVTTLGESLT